MRRNSILLTLYVLALPIAVDRTATPDSSETRLSLIGGVGSYALIARGCENEILGKAKVPFRDVTGSVDHHFAGVWDLGLRGGVIGQDDVEPITNAYLNPNVSVDWKYIGLGVGYLQAEHEFPTGFDGNGGVDYTSRRYLPTGHLRFGNRHGTYGTIEVAESTPFYSGGGYGAAGVGFVPDRHANVWLGVTGGPYDRLGVSLRTDLRVTPSVLANLKARFGSSEGVSENTITVGVTYVIHGTPRTPDAEAPR